MIDDDALKQAVSEAADAVRSCEENLGRAQAHLSEAEREFRLLSELAQMRGLEVHGLAQPSSPGLAVGTVNGDSSETEKQTPKPSKRTPLLSAVIEILAENEKPMQIRELMAAVQARDVRIPGRGQQANLIARISRDPRIVRPRRGYYGLAEWGLKDTAPKSNSKRKRHRTSEASR